MEHLSPTPNDPFDYTDRVATTKWIQNHEWSSNMIAGKQSSNVPGRSWIGDTRPGSRAAKC